MDKTLQTTAWNCLPKEFKKEVKRMWSVEVDCATKYKSELHKHRTDLLYELFGEHLHWQNNHTSDAEGEKMLTAMKWKVQELYANYNKELHHSGLRHIEYEKAREVTTVLYHLFGSKCLPEEKQIAENANCSEPKPADTGQFRFKINDKVRIHGVANQKMNGMIATVEALPFIKEPFKYKVRLEEGFTYLHEDNLEPYEQPKPDDQKFTKGDKVRTMKVMSKDYVGKVGTINCQDDGGYIVDYDDGSHVWSAESDLEPYTEPSNKESATLHAESVKESRISSEESDNDHFCDLTKIKPIESEVSVYLATKEEDEEFRQLLHENGFKWNGRQPLIDFSCWSAHECDKTHYVHEDKTVTYCGEKTSDTLTFSEFKKRYFGGNVNKSQNIENLDKQFDKILKDSFRNHNRLHIAAMCLQGMLSAGDCSGCSDEAFKELAKTALICADALIAEAEKNGGDHEQD